MSRFKKLPIEVKAVKLIEPIHIETPEGIVIAKSGDWLVTDINGEQYPIKHSVFIKTHVPVDDDDKCIYCLYKTLHKCNCDAPCDNNKECGFVWNNWS